jgi:hypothetical protein
LRKLNKAVPGCRTDEERMTPIPGRPWSNRHGQVVKMNDDNFVFDEPLTDPEGFKTFG